MTFDPNGLTDRIRLRVSPQPNGCWNWTHTLDTKGYGQVSVHGRLRMAHRVVYEALVGPIPDGLCIDHLCRNPLCCNPAHLEPVTQRVNTMRGFSPPAVNARKTHCSQGHEFTPENTYYYVTKGRVCRTCHADYFKRTYVPVPRTPRPLATHCRNGHEYTPQNTATRQKAGAAYRVCRACEIERQTSARRDAGIPPRNWRAAA